MRKPSANARAPITGPSQALILTIAAKHAAAVAVADSERAVQVLGAAGCALDSRIGAASIPMPK
ncbi:hypothetical protein ACFQUY_32400 [Nocardia tengchongensis]